MSEFERQQSLGWLINVVAGKAKADLDAELKKHGLSIALWPTMMCLWEEEGVTQRQIAQKAKVESSTTTRTLDKLENLGLVERTIDPNSRRNFRIFLTDKGKKLESILSPIPVAINKALFGPLTEKERAHLIQLLKKVVDDIEL